MDYLELEIKRLTVVEEFDKGTSVVKIDTVDTNGQSHTVEGTGCGVVDAIFSGLLSRYAVEYKSLETIELADFNVVARLDTKNAQSGADAVGEVTLRVRNTEGNSFSFSDASRSITTSVARAEVAVVEYFVNAERAFMILYKSLEDAKARNRPDLVTRYTRELAEVVKSTSYTDVIEKMKRQSGVFSV